MGPAAGPAPQESTSSCRASTASTARRPASTYALARCHRWSLFCNAAIAKIWEGADEQIVV